MRVSYLHFTGFVALTLITVAAVAVLLVPTPSNAAPRGVEGTDPCIDKCLDRHLAQTAECDFVTIQVPGTIGNKSISQPVGEERVDIRAACLEKAQLALEACIGTCDSKTTRIVGRGAVSRSSFTVHRAK
jgi:hypothetical protein